MARQNNENGKRSRSVIARVFTSLFLMLALVLAGAGVAGYFALSAFNAKGPHDKAQVVVIERGSGSAKIARKLAQKGVISNEGLFRLASYFYRGRRGSLKAGEYEIPAHASMNQVMALIRSGKAIVHKVTIPEGWTTAQVLERIAANEVLTGKITLTPGEGTLLPDTYIFKRGDTRDSIIKRMQEAQKHLLDKLWPKRAPGLPVKTRTEALTLASIIEKETGVASERPRIAAVFVNRLKRGMRLQSDPTIIYGMTLGRKKLERELTRRDVAKKTAYNTYQINGLPPGPIANPGRAAIAAALNPQASEDLYFVADGSGGHAFAQNLAGHQKNVRQWRKVKRKRKAEARKKAKDTPAPAPE